MPYYRAATLLDVEELLRALRPDGLLLDVEPSVSHWTDDDAALLAGLTTVRERLEAAAASRTGFRLVFVTNGRRRPAGTDHGFHYLAQANKPWTRDLPMVGPRGWAVCGDQVVTDGLLAWRLRAPFIHLVGPAVSPPWWPRVQAFAARPILKLLMRERTGTA